MSKLILTRGIPASGKSTWAKAWVQEDPDNRVRVNRDDLRRMLFGATDLKLAWAQEVQVTEAERAIAKTALSKGKDVVVDATNLRAKFVRRWFELGYPVEFKDFEVSLSEAIERNSGRYVPLPDDVIERFYHQVTRSGALPEPPVQHRDQVEQYVPDWALPSVFIFDIDGTLAHIPDGGRSPYDYSRVDEDDVDVAVAQLLNHLGDTHQIIIMSGREDSCREATEEWLSNHVMDSYELHMRAAGDKRRDSTVKLELFNEHVRGKYNVLGVFDDRNQVVQMWRDLGLKTYQVAEGDF